MALWVIRAGKQGDQEEIALREKLVCIGWQELPDYSKYLNTNDRNDLRQFYTQIYPGQTEKQIAAGLGQVWRFAKEVHKGDLVALPLKTSAAIAFGRVTGEYLYKKIAPNVMHIRSVEWLKTVPRSAFPDDILTSMNIPLTVFRVSRNETEEYVNNILDSAYSGPEIISHNSLIEIEDDPDANDIDLLARANYEILNFIQGKFKGHALADLIAAILRTQGYKTKVSPPGPDGGVDILAGTGLLGFDQPRLCVQVKSGTGAAEQKIYNELRGVMSKFNSDHGLLVSWGGFTNPVKQDARKDPFKVLLWDKEDVVEAIKANYERLDEKIKASLPLKRIWTLVKDPEI